MNVTFYNFSKRRNSTKQPTGGTSYTCLLKDDTTTARPQIALKWNGSSSAPASWNYCYIADFHRYYWVDSWAYTDRQWVASCTVDVLATYKTEIGSSSKYVLRAASDFDREVIDTIYTPKLVGAPYLATVSAFGNWASNLSGGTIIVGIVGMDDSVAYSANGASYYACTPANYMQFLSDMFTESLVNVNGENYGSTIADAFKAFSRNLLRSVTNPIQYVKSALWFPFSFSTSSGVHPIVGGITSSATFFPLSNPIKTETGTFIAGGYSNDPDKGVWRYVEPFRRVTLHFPPFGTFPIDARKLADGDVTVEVLTDAISGQAHIHVTGSTYGIGTARPVFADSTCQLGVPMDYSGVKTGSVSTSMLAGAIASASVGDTLGAAAGVANMLESAAPISESRGTFGGIAGDIADKVLEVFQYPPIDEDITEKGRPLCKEKTISSLSGYVMCADGEVSCNATEEEHQQLEAFLTGGFFYE